MPNKKWREKKHETNAKKAFGSLIHGIEWSAHNSNRINQIKLLFADENYRSQFGKIK